MRVNWDAKSLNLSDVARELNVGIDSFVFVDDNPGNRAEMRASLPEVTITPFPPDLSLYFHSAALTDEDRMRTAHYKAESLRREEASRLSLDDYLRSLDIKNEIHLITEEEFARVAQLAQKTNQFNVCTNRWTEDDFRAFAADSRHVIFTLHSSDRFGNLGLVAFVHVTVDGDAVAEPKNVYVPIGTRIADIVEFCGGYKKEPRKIIMGGPMMGRATKSDESPTMKNTSAILCFSQELAEVKEETACLNCQRCHTACPFGLMPSIFADAYEAKDVDKLNRFNVMQCMECGSCSYTCPARRPLALTNKLAKMMVKEASK